jgi:hypothetical protein
MEEQREISTVGRNTEGFGGSADGGRPGGSVGLGGQEGGGNSTSGTVSILNPTDEREATIDGMSDEEIQARVPEDIIENVGDDIVARQLYEAALAEDDPVLRERLWEEYRKYNGL